MSRVKSERFTGVVFHEERRQPFTVWVKGEVIKFTTTRDAAEDALLKDLAWRRAGVQA